ncbi:hypothetical protein Hamer_G030708, partial [Homarus americanus]
RSSVNQKGSVPIRKARCQSESSYESERLGANQKGSVPIRKARCQSERLSANQKGSVPIRKARVMDGHPGARLIQSEDSGSFELDEDAEEVLLTPR